MKPFCVLRNAISRPHVWLCMVQLVDMNVPMEVSNSRRLAKGAFRRMKSAWSDGTMDTCMGRRRSAMRRWRMVGRECSGVRGPLVGGGEHHIESSEALGDVLGLDGAVLR